MAHTISRTLDGVPIGDIVWFARQGCAEIARGFSKRLGNISILAVGQKQPSLVTPWKIPTVEAMQRLE